MISKLRIGDSAEKMKFDHSLQGYASPRRSTVRNVRNKRNYCLNLWCCSFFLILKFLSIHAECTTDKDCDELFEFDGSKCIDNKCTNPFHYNGGCLSSMLGDDWRIKNGPRRICGSEDPPDAVENGYCRISPLDEYYTEVRILTLGWESVNFQAWMLQILLSEVLQIPTSIETGSASASVDFYGVDKRMDYPSYDATYAELNVSSEVLDCRLLNNDPNYTACAHVVPEVWQADTLVDSKAVGTGPFRDSGMLASQKWYVPKFTALRDASLTNIYGLAGDEHREKLAKNFKRPTTWKEYCDEVSLDGCVTDDGVASRPPSEGEESSMFQDGAYTGHFRYTEANNCTGYPNSNTCTGHFSDYPCGWNSQAPQQIYHNNIALQSDGTADHRGGYSYSQLVGIWRAANATKENVMIMWWTPEVLFEEFFGTDAEFVPVQLHQPTQECYEARPPRGSMCDETFDVSSSDPKGSCDYTVQLIKKFISDGLYETSFDSSIPEPLQSPAVETVDHFRMSSLQLGEIFQRMLERKKDYNFDARYATCEWFTENLDLMLSFVPDSHPRIIQEIDVSTDPMFIGALAIACLSSLFVLFSFIIVGLKRNTKVIFDAQPESLSILLFGLLLVSVATILLVTPHTDKSCISTSWLINLGYAVHFAPLVSKIFAINSLHGNDGKQMRRMRLSKIQLFRTAFLLTAAVTAFMVIWTIKDPPEKVYAYELTETMKDDATIVASSNYCGSDSDLWEAISLGWQACVLLPTAVVAFVACRVREDMNDTKSLSVIVYTHCFFLTFRATLFLVDDGSAPCELMAYRSLLLTGDILFALATYFFPKLVDREELKEEEEILPDLFLNSSIFVADIMGFTAWSSAREPHQVFKLLETLYQTFDTVADKHKVYKVETVRDCYVAATGIPNPQIKHAEIISKFAIEVLKRTDMLSKKLELMFGPDTGELTVRVGIHSGPVTGGFLRGKGARFQLFGDTMTTACLIQSTGMSNRIHLSQTTANLLIESGRKRWITKRDAKISTEEKGDLETYWLTRGVKDLGDFDGCASSVAYSDFMSMVSELDNDDYDLLADGRLRWIEWNVDVLSGVLKQILAQRDVSTMDEAVRSVKNMTSITQKSVRSFNMSELSLNDSSCHESRTNSFSVSTQFSQSETMPLDEVAEIIKLPAFDKKAAKRQRDNSSKKDLDPVVMSQLKEYVTMVASMYRENPFHNFAHASYVVMAVSKYMNRIMAASEVDLGNDGERQRSSTFETLHDHTYGITSDPLTRFACVFSALIHDIDHPGVPNPRLIQENERLARMYKKRSVAEQNSFDLAWELLMDDSFGTLRKTICPTAKDLRRFRQIVVNSVMATDLGDKEMKELRNGRWNTAFKKNGEVQEENLSVATNRKATIVIEHLIQAADVAHMCQHWNLYRKWNERLFQEHYKAYRDGREDKSPSEGWYEGEMGFYDFYIIPLAKKLRDCGVFGPTSDENLNYATSNRAQWEKEGKDIVAKMLHKAEEEYNAQYMEESCNNMSPDSEFVSGEFSDEQILVRFEDHPDDRNKVITDIPPFSKEKKLQDEPIMVRFKDQQSEIIHDDSKVADEEILQLQD